MAVPRLVGRTGQVTCVVTEADTAQTLGSGDVAVLGTPRLIALCEEATCRAIVGALPEDHTTVGVEITFRHRRPTWPGEEVIARARVVSADERRIEFDVEVYPVNRDASRASLVPVETLASGIIRRAIVPRAMFDRSGPPGGS